MGLTCRASFKAANASAFVSRFQGAAAQGALDAATAGQAISVAIVPKVTGDLAADITVKSGASDSGAWAAWGPDSVPYRFYVEYGTGKRGAASAMAGPGPYKLSWPGMTPRPYMRPAQDELTPQVLDIIANSIRGAL
jgi:hypothetical protein